MIKSSERAAKRRAAKAEALHNQYMLSGHDNPPYFGNHLAATWRAKQFCETICDRALYATYKSLQALRDSGFSPAQQALLEADIRRERNIAMQRWDTGKKFLFNQWKRHYGRQSRYTPDGGRAAKPFTIASQINVPSDWMEVRL